MLCTGCKTDAYGSYELVLMPRFLLVTIPRIGKPVQRSTPTSVGHVLRVFLPSTYHSTVDDKPGVVIQILQIYNPTPVQRPCHGRRMVQKTDLLWLPRVPLYIRLRLQSSTPTRNYPLITSLTVKLYIYIFDTYLNTGAYLLVYENTRCTLLLGKLRSYL
jgi:hypothetical protein